MKKMRTIAGILGVLVSLFLFGSCSQEEVFTEKRELEMAAEGVRVLEINGGNGDIGINGSPSMESIAVTGNITVSGEDAGENPGDDQ